MNNSKKISQLKIIAQPNGCGKVCIANLVHNFIKWSLHAKRWYAKLLMQMISWSFFYFFFHWFQYQWIENNMNVFDSWKIVDFMCFNSNPWPLILITCLPFRSILWICCFFFLSVWLLGFFSFPSDGFISFWLSLSLLFLLNTHTYSIKLSR